MGVMAEVQKLYVGNFPYTTTEQELHALFEDYGKVKSVRIILNAETGKSKGYAFVEMSTPREATEALKALDQFGYEGRRLRVGYAHPKKEGD